MFEDAAGIALYKVRKQEALKKLSDTRAHLTRIEDIIHELQSQEEEIRESAARAREYLDFKQQADAIEISPLWAGKYHELQNRLEKAGSAPARAGKEQENCRAQLQAAGPRWRLRRENCRNAAIASLRWRKTKPSWPGARPSSSTICNWRDSAKPIIRA